jgi:uncharacterized membrane protein YsdA (DUF1294 family)
MPTFELTMAIMGFNLISFGLMGLDKQRAIHHQWRISESTLLSVALFGGSLGILFGMLVFHHKTAKPLFFIGIPVIFGIQVLALLQFI